MAIELEFLAWAVVLGIAQLLLAATLATARRGLKWNASARDGTPPPLEGAAGRAERAFRNLLETFPFFAAAVLGVVAAGRTGHGTALGVQLYLWARLLYVPLYLAGIPYLRSAVWAVSMLGLVMVLWPLLR
ncbi:MAPEG family protein [Pseudoxanthomonas suwonensis]|uniref:MAPEG family protein n=1 Tax=Pseudoxanthomonas suwonensis TaxID=314722 RepID=UPI0004668DFC|nr:MAPEG family protein [Pseudoxanthomonas suwonensis]